MATSIHSILCAAGPKALTYGIQPEIEGDPDAALIAAWNLRQTSLAEIEARGAYYSFESHSEAAGDLMDAAEGTVRKLTAKTPRGVIAKLWCGLAHTGDGFTEAGRIESDIIRRADFAEVRAMMEADELEYAQDLIVAAIGDLIAMGEA